MELVAEPYNNNNNNNNRIGVVLFDRGESGNNAANDNKYKSGEKKKEAKGRGKYKRGKKQDFKKMLMNRTELYQMNPNMQKLIDSNPDRLTDTILAIGWGKTFEDKEITLKRAKKVKPRTMKDIFSDVHKEEVREKDRKTVRLETALELTASTLHFDPGKDESLRPSIPKDAFFDKGTGKYKKYYADPSTGDKQGANERANDITAYYSGATGSAGTALGDWKLSTDAATKKINKLIDDEVRNTNGVNIGFYPSEEKSKANIKNHAKKVKDITDGLLNVTAPHTLASFARTHDILLDHIGMDETKKLEINNSILSKRLANKAKKVVPPPAPTAETPVPPIIPAAIIPSPPSPKIEEIEEIDDADVWEANRIKKEKEEELAKKKEEKKGKGKKKSKGKGKKK